MKFWRTKHLDLTTSSATEATLKLVNRFQHAAIIPPQFTNDVRAWGQFLDDEHHSDTQWGLYGTSAGVVTIALKERHASDGTRARLMESALKLLRSVFPAPTSPGFASKVEKGDLKNIIKLAYVADALEPARDDVHDAETPEVVREILRLALDGEKWSSRDENDPTRDRRDLWFPTASVLLVLHRYEHARAHDTYNRAQVWLARLIQDTVSIRTESNCALFGLALLKPGETDLTRNPVVTAALDTCQETLLAWAWRQRNIVIDRPVFYGFSLGHRTNYGFLHPELLATQFLMLRGNPRRGRRFVLDVVHSLAENVNRNQGFMIQNGVMSAVDQMWAMRVLTRFIDARHAAGGTVRLLPVRDQRIFAVDNRSRVWWITGVVLVIAGATIAASDSIWVGAGIALAGISSVVLNVLLMPGAE